MFQFFKKEKATPVLLESVALFGKLPGIADYTKVNAHLDHAILINSELENMVSGLHEEGSPIIAGLDMQCVFEVEGRWLVVQVCHSQDKSGRSYPFTGVGYLSHPLMKECQPAMPLVLSRFEAYLLDLKNRVGSKTALESALKEIDELRFSYTKSSLLEEEITLLKKCPQTTWLAQAFPAQSRQTIADRILSVGRDILSYKKGEPVHLVFSLSPEHTLLSSVLWLQWIESLLQPKRWSLRYCMVKTANQAHMHVWLSQTEYCIADGDFLSWVKPAMMRVKHGTASHDFIELLSREEFSTCDALYRWQQEVMRVPETS